MSNLMNAGLNKLISTTNEKIRNIKKELLGLTEKEDDVKKKLKKKLKSAENILSILGKAENPKCKNFIIDSSVLLYSPYSMFSFDDNVLIIPSAVIKEVSEMMGKAGEIGANAREVNIIIDKLLNESEKVYLEGNSDYVTIGPIHMVSTENGGIIMIMQTKKGNLHELAEYCDATIVSRNPYVRINAKMKEIKAEEYKSEQVLKNGEQEYTGRSIIYVSLEEMSIFNRTGKLELNKNKKYYITNNLGIVYPEDYKLTINEFILLQDENGSSKAGLLGRFDGEKIVKLCFYDKDHTVYGIKPINVGQIFALEALLAPPEIAPMVILKGPAGTAKTFLSMAVALEQVYKNKEAQYKRILLTRPNKKMDEDIGFLKGSEEDKISPVLRGLLDNVENLMPNKISNKSVDIKKDGAVFNSPVDELVSKGILSMQAMAYMRGRSICNQYIVVDELQNANPTQALSVASRPGQGSKIVLLGDTDQIDDPYLDKRNNGLTYVSERMKGSPLCWQITFTESESTRSPLAKEVVKRMTLKGTDVNFK